VVGDHRKSTKNTFVLSKQEGGAYYQCWVTNAVMRFKITSA